MVDIGSDYSGFLEAVIPDVNREMDRICLTILELELQELRRSAKDSLGNFSQEKYDEGVKALRDSLYGDPKKTPRKKESDSAPRDWTPSDSKALYPALHLCYWVEVRAAYWRTAPAPANSEKARETLYKLLGEARTIQNIINEQQRQAQQALQEEAKGTFRRYPGRIAQVRAAQKLTLDKVVARYTAPTKTGK